MFKRKGQNIAEYSILIAIVIAAAVAMQVYVRRGLQGRVADAVDHQPDLQILDGTGSDSIAFTTKQYEPYYLEKEANITSDRSYDEEIASRGEIERTGIDEETRREADSFEEDQWVGFERDVYDPGRP